jgi:hypothetical protein
MRVLVLAFALSGCVTDIRLTSEQTCAQREMVLDGEEIGHTGGVGVMTTGAVGVYGGQTVTARCAKPKTEMETCRIEKLKASIPPLEAYNATVVETNACIGFGYVFAIIPGIVMYKFANDDREKALLEVRNLASEADRCGGTIAH